MPSDKLEGLDRTFFRFELKLLSQNEGLRIPMVATGRFGKPMCPWCGDKEVTRSAWTYAQHVLKEHREGLKPYKGARSIRATQENVNYAAGITHD